MEDRLKRIMIAGVKSGSGKTIVTCGLLKALKDRNYDVSSYKCGPDYIDPMFHSAIIGAWSENLDSFFCNTPELRHILAKRNSDIAVIEGVMGYFDGAGSTGSSKEIAMKTGTPAVIVIDCRGMSGTIGAIVSGMINYSRPNNICGFIFNRLSENLVPEVKEICAQYNTQYLGRFPADRGCVIESRHLGLITASEIDNLKKKVEIAGDICRKYIDIEKILEIASKAEKITDEIIVMKKTAPVGIKIAVSKDEAFCFHYEENYDILRNMGCEIVTFSPLSDKALPEDISGIILCGGYPELYAARLSDNKKMLESIRKAAKNGMPMIAECGGFMYLHDKMEGDDGKEYDMAGVIHAKAFKTDRLRRFGYVKLEAIADNMLCKKGDVIKAHEYHYWDSTCPGEDFEASKINKKISYRCAHGGENIYAGFPHLYFGGNMSVAERFVEKCYGQNKKHKKN